MDMMRDFVDGHVRTRMERVPGVSRVELWGGAGRQVQILVDPAALAERDLTIAGVRRALTARTGTSRVGSSTPVGVATCCAPTGVSSAPRTWL
jgi:multidrug efflux pump subunit AcrB